jgi:hypothetical protein
MTPMEAAIRAVCRHIGADPDTWRGFEGIGRVALEALFETLPTELAEQLRLHVFPTD